jgi:amino acid adenylation domain-containing protein
MSAGAELLPGVTLVRSEERTTYPLALSVDDLSSGFNIAAQTFAHIGSERVCRLMLSAVEALTDALERAPHLQVRQLSILSGTERQRLLEHWSGRMRVGSAAADEVSGIAGAPETPADASGVAPRHCTGISLFETQVQRDPDAVAVVQGGRRLTYGELNARANRLAQRLIGQGVGPEQVVGVWADRSLEMLIGMLGIWKAGGAYLPLDPAYPVQRLQLMLSEAQPVLVLGSAAAPKWPLGQEVALLAVDSGDGPGGSEDNPRTQAQLAEAQRTEVRRAEAQRSDAQRTEAQRNEVRRTEAPRPDHAAYVIYTSGSSGTPKGVVVTHSGLGALAATQRKHLQITPRSRVLQLASLNFDASVWDVLSALSNGAALVLAPAGAVSGEALRDLLVRERVTHALLTPSVLATLERSPELSLQCLVVGGEACPAELVARWSAGVRMLNAYGPTESTVCATLSEPLEAGAAVPIGRPIAGTYVYVLDESLEPVPVGVTGELYIGGVGLARGYLGRAGLTAERFVADPYAAPGSRMYRSGDRVRWTSAGVLEYLGRADQQVKVRGQRIELGEIEAVLCAQESIEQAAVIVREDGGSEKYLAAYVVCCAGHELEVGRLRGALAERLPQYMLPAHVIQLPALPLTLSGKLDRTALPAPPHRANPGDSTYEPPVGPLETTHAAIRAD